VKILRWNRAAKKRTGHICTIPRIGTQAWVLGMHSQETRSPPQGVSVNQRGNEAHDYRGDMNGPGIQALVPTYKEHYWQERRVVIPLRRPPEGVGVGTSIPP
jgi:hypothetical protein